MSRLRLRHLTSPGWRCGVPGALVGSVAVALANYPFPDATGVSLTPLLWGSLLAGYLARGIGVSAQHAGFRAAVVGVLATVPFVARLPPSWATGNLAGWWPPGPIDLLGFVFAGAMVLWLVVIVGVPGLVAGKVGGWIATKLGHEAPPATPRRDSAERAN